MLHLKNISKQYKAGTMTVEALKGLSLEFGENEFVCILGPSGCGKTTLLNIIGGLDQYTEGDLVINGKSTEDFKDADWDAYRNHSIGFVFQTYNLIPHQTVLANVELALTLTGVTKAERTARAKEVICSVGLADQIYKKPNQLSGGQMQRVAIARALVNNPDILLADEPTGSLDSETSVQIMELLKEISEDKLVIMVTHNPELADRYSTRIVNLLDGLVVSDSAPGDFDIKTQEADRDFVKCPSMSFFTALALSLNNLLTKKTRTLLTAFAGSIGIIGIALILALSHGLQGYINRVEEETLSSYPLTIEREAFDISGFIQNDGSGESSGTPGGSEPRPADRIFVNNVMSRIFNTMMDAIESNDLARFKESLEADSEALDRLVTSITYGYSVDLHIYQEDGSGGLMQVNPSRVFEELGMTGGSGPGGMFSSPMTGNSDMWVELIDNPEFLETQYDLLAGGWPQDVNDVVLVVSGGGRITDLMLYSLGLRGPDDLRIIRQALISGEPIPVERGLSYSHDEILDLRFRLILPADRYQKTESGWADMSDDFIHMQNAAASADEIRITGILRPNEDAVAVAVSGVVGYTSGLMRHVIEKANESEIVRQQRMNPEIDVFTGRRFDAGDEPLFSEIEDIYAYIQTMPEETREQSAMILSSMREAGTPDAQIVAMFNQSARSEDESSFEGNLALLGAANLNEPSSISIFPSSFENKEAIISYIDEYNEKVGEEYEITYTDFVGLLMSSVTTVINAISYVLIAFVSISLVVSSIMIGIITYISVLERTKEIGILRSIGASKRDISRVFNAETLIIGFVAGALGIAVTLLLCIPANAIIFRLTEIRGVAQLPLSGGVVLVLISMILSLLAGLIPSRIAANKNPVVALRTE